MVHDSFWFVHLQCTLEMNKVHNLSLLFCFRSLLHGLPVTRMNSVVRHRVVQFSCSSCISFLVMHFTVFGVYAPWYVNLPHQIGKKLTVPSLAFYTGVHSIYCFLF